MDNSFMIKSEIFNGISEEEMKSLTECLQAHRKQYEKGEQLYRCGDRIEAMGLVLSGTVNIEQNDVWGRQTILDTIGAGQVFAEVYACLPGELLLVDVTAATKTEVLFLNIEKVLLTCHSACGFHTRLIRNLLKVMARKNINITRKISHITKRSIRERLLSYLSYQTILQGTHEFEIPFNRQQLADYLCVDRSALSGELGKMQKEGLLTCRKNSFRLHTEALLHAER